MLLPPSSFLIDLIATHQNICNFISNPFLFFFFFFNRSPTVDLDRFHSVNVDAELRQNSMADGSSKMLHENDRNRGYVQKFLHFLDLHQRLRLPKTLTYPKQIPRIRVRSPKKKQNAAAFEDDRNDKEKDATSSVRSDKHGRNYPRVLVKNLITRRRSGDKDKKQNTTPSASQMKRTLSIHRLDSDDYVARDPEPIRQITTERADGGKVDSEQPILQCTSDSSVGDVEFRNNNSLKEATPVSSSVVGKQYRFCRSRSSIDGLNHDQLHELWNLIAEGQTENAANAGTELYQSMFMDIMQQLMKNKDLFLMFLQDPPFDSTDRAQRMKELRKSGSFPGVGWFQKNNLSTVDHKETENGSTGKKQKSIQDDARSVVLTEYRDSDEDKDQKNVTTVSRHFKVLKKKIKDVIKENNKEQERISMDGIFHRIPYGEKASNIKMKETRLASTSNNNKLKKMRKSTSLTESLGRYSQLLESVSSTGAKRSRVVENSVESISNIEAKRTPSIANLIKENKDAPTKKGPRALGRMFSLQDLDSYSLSKNHSQLPLKPERLEDQPMKKHGSSKIVETKEQVLPINEQKLVAYEALELSIIKDRSYCFEDDYSNDVLRTPTEILVADSRGLKDDLSSETGQFFRDIEEIPRDENVEDLFDEAQSLRLKKHGSFHIQVDEMNETDFEYVRNILLKSRIGSEEALGEWYLPDQPVDPSLFEEEEECSSQALMLHGNELNTTLKHMLLFDLINEVLLQIYDASFAYCPWALQPDCRIRPVPVGRRVLEEVWAVISKHLSHQLLLDQTVESTVARDFMKNDGWMDLQHDTEFVALNMEDWILEDLIEDIILDFDDIWIEKFIVDYDDTSDLEFLAYQLEG